MTRATLVPRCDASGRNVPTTPAMVASIRARGTATCQRCGRPVPAWSDSVRRIVRLSPHRGHPVP